MERWNCSVFLTPEHDSTEFTVAIVNETERSDRKYQMWCSVISNILLKVSKRLDINEAKKSTNFVIDLFANSLSSIAFDYFLLFVLL